MHTQKTHTHTQPGALGGFVGPVLIGTLKQKTNSYDTAMYVLASFVLTAAILVAAFNPAWAERWMLKHKADALDEEAAAGGGAESLSVEASKAAVTKAAVGKAAPAATHTATGGAAVRGA